MLQQHPEWQHRIITQTDAAFAGSLCANLLVNSHVELTSLQALVDRVAGPEAKDIVMTAGEQPIQEGERAFLWRMLRRRFGDQVNAAIAQRVATASSEQISTWEERMWSATSLSELLAD